jgi:hypothetical protein
MADPVSWLLIEPGWKVVDADGQNVGRVEEVVGDANADIFDGIAFAPGALARPKYVPAEQVDAIEQGIVRLSVGKAAVGALTEYKR